MPKVKNEDSIFITKLFDLINKYSFEKESEHALRMVEWEPFNKGFIINDKQKFIKNVLQQNFTIRRFDSFVRKLNKYGFKRSKIDKIKFRFFHKDFTQDGKSIEKIKKLSKQEALPRHIKLRLMREKMCSESMSELGKQEEVVNQKTKGFPYKLKNEMESKVLDLGDEMKSESCKIGSKDDIGIYLLKEPEIKLIQLNKCKKII